MNEFSKITLPSGTYTVKDTTARKDSATAKATADSALSKATQNQTDITALQGKVTNNTNNISSLTTRVTKNESDIETLQTNVGNIKKWNITYADDTITFTEG